MTTPQIVAILGKPTKVEPLKGVESWHWEIAEGGGPSGGYTIIVQDGKALAVPPVPDFEQDDPGS
jgi:hypothetical protein